MAFLFFVLSCGRIQDTADGTGLRVTHQELQFQFRESSYPVTVLTEFSWRLESDSEWLSASIEGAEQGETFFILVTRNDSGEDRSGIITISNHRGSKTIKVTQKRDDRNFTDIILTTELMSNSRVKDSWLLIPYRNGLATRLSNISVGVAGEGKGSLSVESLENAVLNDGEGEIKLKVSGRAGSKGKVLFTVAGLPPTVFGEAAQCQVEVIQGAALKDYTISQMRALGEGKVTDIVRFSGYVVSDATEGVFDDHTFIIEDADAGIEIKTATPFNAEFGDCLEIYAENATISKETGLLTLNIPEIDDIRKSKGMEMPEPLEISSPDIALHESMLCFIDMTQLTEEELTKEKSAGSSVMERLGWKGTYKIYVPPTASFAERKLPSGSGRLTGIVSANENGETAIIPTRWDCIASLTGNRLVMDAKFETDKTEIDDIPSNGATGVSFVLTSSVDWNLECEETDWITGWSAKSGIGSGTPVTISFDVKPNTGARRSAIVKISGSGVPEIKIRIVQLEGNRILDNDFSGVRDALLENPKYFPLSAGTDYAKTMDSIGLGGWYATNCYGALSDSEGKQGLLRIGKTLSKGYIMTPKLTAIGSVPVSIEANFLAGIYKGCVTTWIGIEIDGPGVIMENDDVVIVNGYDDTFTAALMDKIPMAVVRNLDSKNLRRVSIRIDGATEETSIRLTATIKGGSTVAACNLFFVGDFHVEYVN